MNLNSAFTWHIQVITNMRCYYFGEDPNPIYCGDKKTYTIKAREGHRIVGIRCKARCSDKDAQPSDVAGTCGWIPNTLYSISHVYECEMGDLATEDDTFYTDYYDVIHAKKITEIKGATFGNCINKLQFVYDNNESLTNMHGISIDGEKPFSLKVDKPLTRLEYHTAESDDPQYGGSPFLTYLQIEGEENNSVGTPDKSLPLSFYHKHSYNIKSSEGEELWTFSGLFNNYMGLFLSYYVRDIQSGKELCELPENKTKNDVLVVNVMKDYNTGKDENRAAKILIGNWAAWYLATDEVWKQMYGKNAVKRLKGCDVIPPKSLSTNLNCQNINCDVEEDTIQNAIKSKQYKYITFHCHGTYTYVGNLSKLLDNIWVLDPKNKGIFDGTVFNFNCCECGYRLIDNYTQKPGLAVALKNAGAEATFGYTVGLEISNRRKYYDAADKTGNQKEIKLGILFKNLCLRFIGAVDKSYLEGETTFNDVAASALAEFNNILKTTMTEFDLNKDIINCCLNEYKKEKDDDNFVETTEIYCMDNGRMQRFTKILDSNGVTELKKIAYQFYFQVYFAIQHFVGPGDKSPDKKLKKKNLGELCNEYGNDGGEL